MAQKGFIGVKRLERILPKLKEIERAATMRTADFGGQGRSLPDEIKEADVTKFIRERTRLFRETWLIQPLEGIIRELEGCLKGGQ